VLYRPPPLPPRWTEEIVRRWGQIPEATDDVGRIEEMDDDEVGHPDAEMMDIEDEMDMDIG
jgi:hypothetical protein